MELFVTSLSIQIIAVLLFIFSIYLCYRKSRDIFQKIVKTRKLIVSNNTWVKVQGKILRLGVNIDYDYPEKLPDVKGDESDQDLELILARHYKEISIRNKMKEFEGLYIKYAYSHENKKYVSRRISELADANDIELVYRYTPNDKVEVYVNKAQPSYSVLVHADDKRYSKYFWRMLCEVRNEFFFVVLTGILIILMFQYN